MNEPNDQSERKWPIQDIHLSNWNDIFTLQDIQQSMKKLNGQIKLGKKINLTRINQLIKGIYHVLWITLENGNQLWTIMQMIKCSSN